MTKLSAKELRDLPEGQVVQPQKRYPVYLILDNIYDTYNIGGNFRLADALAVEKVYLCGDTETPPNHRIQKASVGTWKVVPWEYAASAHDAILHLKSKILDLTVVSIEQHPTAVPYHTLNYSLPLALVVGNETQGVSPEALAASDAIVEISMFGINKSLNVIVSAAIVSFHAYLRLGLTK